MLLRIFTFLGLLISLSSQAGLFDQKPKFLPAQEAFAFSSQLQTNQLSLHWDIAEGYYLYQKELKINGQKVQLGEIAFPQAETHQDEFFGKVAIYRKQLDLNVPFSNQQTKALIEIGYQGCTEGFCYPPETVKIELAAQAVSSEANFAKNQENLTASPMAEQDQLAEKLAQNRLSLFWFLILGIGLAFTPCVLPMLPLLSAIVIGNQQRPNTAKALLLSLSYVQGMAFTYTLLGLIVAAIGLPFQVALQSPPVLIGLAILFTLLALSMFGLFSLQLPQSWQQKLNQLSQKQQGGKLLQVFVMGMIAGLVASPCTSAPLSGALLYVAQSGDLFIGGLALYLLALGMGIPLILITLFGNQILPKSGEWLLKVKTAFGFVMLALPIFLITRLLPQQWEALLWSVLAIAFLIWLIESVPHTKFWQKALKAMLFIGLILAGKPVADLIWQTPTESRSQTHFIKIHNLAEFEEKLTASKGKKVMLDLYADWCVACKEFEKYTFSEPDVQQKFAEMVIMQIDMSQNSAENRAFTQKFNILGLPTLLFFDEQGKEYPQRITGFMPSDEFLNWLNQL